MCKYIINNQSKNMKKNIFYLLLMLGVSLTLQAQKAFFNKTISEGGGYFYPLTSRAAIEGGVMVNGIRSKKVGNAYKENGFILVCDKKGTVLQAKEFMEAQDYGILSSLQLRNGNYVFSYRNTSSQGILVMTNANFDVIWTLNSPNLFYECIELSNGNILASSAGSVATLQLINANNGTLIWSKNYVSTVGFAIGFSSNNYHLKELSDGNILYTCIETVFFGTINVGRKPKILKLNSSDGSIIWQKEFNNNTINDENIQDVCEDSDGSLLLCYISNTPYSSTKPSEYAYPGILKLDKNGNKVWFKKFATVGSLTLHKLSNGIFAGVLLPTQGPLNQMSTFFKINKSGIISEQFKEPIPVWSNAIWTTDKNFVLIGLTPKCQIVGAFDDLILQQRSFSEKSPCAEAANLTLNDSTIVASDIYKEIKAEGFAKVTATAAPIIKDIKTQTGNDAQYCVDTTFAKRCDGDSYVVGKNTYTKSGVYKDIVATANCDSMILTKLTIGKTALIKIDTGVCEGKTFSFGSKKYNKTGVYSDTLINGLGCDSIIRVDLKISTLKIIATSADTTVQIAEAIPLRAEANILDVTWEWQPNIFLSCSDCADPISTPLKSTLYTVFATDKLGCQAEAKLSINVKGGEEIYVPNVFSPNGDAINDRLIIFANTRITQIKQFAVYDRWGNLVYEANNFPPNDFNYGWDGVYRGQKSLSGIYVYRISIERADGTIKILKGDVLIP